MSLSELVSLRDRLVAERLPDEPDTIVALRVPGAERYHLGRTSRGQFCALIQTEGRRTGVDVRLQNLEVRQGVRCRVLPPGGPEEVLDGSLVICRAEQPSLINLFLRLFADAVEELGRLPTSDAVSTWLQQLASLLSRLEQEGRRRLQGLWAELLVMRELGDPQLLLRRWRADPKERFDFLASGFGIEVKSCQDFRRVHEFSLEQLRPPPGLSVWVASVVVRPDPVGISVLELLATVEASIPDMAARQALREITFATAGSLLEDDEHHRFEAEIARASLRLFDAAAVPSISEPLAPQILSVSLRVQCDGLAEVGTRAEAVARLGAPPREDRDAPADKM